MSYNDVGVVPAGAGVVAARAAAGGGVLARALAARARALPPRAHQPGAHPRRRRQVSHLHSTPAHLVPLKGARPLSVVR